MQVSASIPMCGEGGKVLWCQRCGFGFGDQRGEWIGVDSDSVALELQASRRVVPLPQKMSAMVSPTDESSCISELGIWGMNFAG